MCVETLTGVLFWSFDLLGNFRAACFPFETSSGSLEIPQVVPLAKATDCQAAMYCVNVAIISPKMLTDVFRSPSIFREIRVCKMSRFVKEDANVKINIFSQILENSGKQNSRDVFEDLFI